MKKKMMIMILVGMLTLAICSCGKNEYREMDDDTNTESEMIQENESSEEIPEDSVNHNEITNDNEMAFSFSDLKNVEFWFASGAGGWSTTMTIGDDGSFSGVYHDADMGDQGENYPNGTIYYCSFSGQFADLEQVAPYSYVTSIESITFDNPADTEEIKENTRYIYTEAYGLDDPKDILIYLPGMPTADLPDGYLSWVGSELYISYDSVEMAETLPFYGLYNVNAEQGFSSYDVVEQLKETLAYTEEQAAVLEDSIRNDTLNQAEYNEKLQELYEQWDFALNSVWSVLKQTLDEETMRALTVEEREWIASKEQEVEEAGAEFEGGSMQPMIMYQKAAELTKARVYELYELVEKSILTGSQTEMPEKDAEPADTLESLAPDTIEYYMSIEPACSFLMPDGMEYRMIAVDRALGSSYYVLTGTYDKGKTCSFINTDPYNGSGGEAKWISFVDDSLGFSCLARSGGSYGELYRTEDGGNGFTQIEYPSPKITLSDGTYYNPFVMPEKVYEEDGILFLEVGQEPDGDYYGENGYCHGLYQSSDGGLNWEFVKEIPVK